MSVINASVPGHCYQCGFFYNFGDLIIDNGEFKIHEKCRPYSLHTKYVIHRTMQGETVDPIEPAMTARQQRIEKMRMRRKKVNVNKSSRSSQEKLSRAN